MKNQMGAVPALLAPLAWEALVVAGTWAARAATAYAVYDVAANVYNTVTGEASSTPAEAPAPTPAPAPAPRPPAMLPAMPPPQRAPLNAPANPLIVGAAVVAIGVLLGLAFTPTKARKRKAG